METEPLSALRVAASDLNGQMRGKRLPASYGDKLHNGVVRMPFSALNLDIWGQDIGGSPLVFASGDADGVLLPTDRGPVPMPWLASPASLVPMAMFAEDGQPFDGDPRHALNRVVGQYDQRGWALRVGLELEFTLVDDSADTLAPPALPGSGRKSAGAAILSLAEIDALDGFFTDLYAACDAMDIPAGTVTSEGGLGQFEVTLSHQPPLRAADDAWLFKALVRGLARRHGMAATFMAKPYSDDVGNGLHAHMSVTDTSGGNVFDDGGPLGAPVLHHAIAGCLAAMPASTLVFAPFPNSYDRLVPSSHAPVHALWGYENRTAAIRVPGGPPAARRIEHRAAGGDTNPYLILTAILGAALSGIQDGQDPPAPVTGNAYAQHGAPCLATDLSGAIAEFARSPAIKRIFPSLLIDNLIRTKRQELAGFAEIPAQRHWLSYLETV